MLDGNFSSVTLGCLWNFCLVFGCDELTIKEKHDYLAMSYWVSQPLFLLRGNLSHLCLIKFLIITYYLRYAKSRQHKALFHRWKQHHNQNNSKIESTVALFTLQMSTIILSRCAVRCIPELHVHKPQRCLSWYVPRKTLVLSYFGNYHDSKYCYSTTTGTVMVSLKRKQWLFPHFISTHGHDGNSFEPGGDWQKMKLHVGKGRITLINNRPTTNQPTFIFGLHLQLFRQLGVPNGECHLLHHISVRVWPGRSAGGDCLQLYEHRC